MAVSAPRFGAFILHNDQCRRDPETGVRIFRFELTNDTSQYPLGRVVCPESGVPGTDDSAVALLSTCLPQLARLDKESRLEAMRNLIRLNSAYWQIGKNQPTDPAGERLADRGARLLQQSTATIQQNPNGSLSMIMDYDLDQRGISLTKLLQQQRQAVTSQPGGGQFQAVA